MNLSVWSSYYIELSPEDAITEFAKHGINYTELSDEHGYALLKRSNPAETGKAFGEFARNAGVNILQGHLWLKCRICEFPDSVEILKDWIDMYETIGIKSMVLHCDNLVNTNLGRQEKIEENIGKLKELADYIKDKDVTICLENLRPHGKEDMDLVDRNADDLLYIIDRIGSDKFGICLDTGHLNLTDKNQREFILKAGKKLKAIHIADNEGEIDQHMMPFGRGTVDFYEVIRALREVGFDMPINYEIPGESTNKPLEIKGYKLEYIKKAFEYLINNA